MASLSLRSSRRSEGLTTRPSTRNNVYSRHQQSNIGRKKRARDSLDDDEQSMNAKKARIAVEIISLPKNQPKTRSVFIRSDTNGLLPNRSAAEPAPKAAAAARTATSAEPSQKPTNHHNKVVNGIKHELDRLLRSEADLKDEKRKLRSQEGTRFKSELSAYFPEYDEVIGNEPKEDHILNFDTPIIIVDSALPPTKQPPPSPRKTNGPAHEYPLKEFPSSLFDDLHDAQRVDFSFLGTRFNEEGEDPLSDSYFESIHRKPERQEKTIRNTDRGRAQHEKDQVIRLLEGLQGHDWLKLMGVSGITDSRRKEYEPARTHFIKGCEAIIEKFRTWREEEKRRKLERELAIAETEAEEEEEEQEGIVSDGEPPDYSDVDASAARQLQEEAIARSAPRLAPKKAEKQVRAEPMPAAVPVLEKDFKSFFTKPHFREAALGKHRRSGRSVAAWGHLIPDVPMTDFDLPEEYRDEETLRVHARRKRRDRRVSKT